MTPATLRTDPPAATRPPKPTPKPPPPRRIVQLQWGDTGRSISVPLPRRLGRIGWIVGLAWMIAAVVLGWQIVSWFRVHPMRWVEERRAASLERQLARTRQEVAAKERRLGEIDTLAQRLSTFYGLALSPVPPAALPEGKAVLETLFPGSDSTERLAEEAGRLALLARLRIADLERAAARARAMQARWSAEPSIAPTHGQLVSNFGYRVNPVTGRYTPHKGVDLVNRTGTPIHASADGVVAEAEYSPSFGKMVVLRHGNGIRTLYAHMSSIRVRAGERVRRGQIIGAMGSTGRSTGTHLHYEVHVGGAPLNPLRWILPVTLSP